MENQETPIPANTYITVAPYVYTHAGTKHIGGAIGRINGGARRPNRPWLYFIELLGGETVELYGYEFAVDEDQGRSEMAFRLLGGEYND